MPHRYRVWEDFGPAGTRPDSVEFEYHSSHGPPVSDNLEAEIQDIWGTVTDERPELFDAPSFNLLGVSGRRLELGPIRFKHHIARQRVVSGTYDGLPAELRDELCRSVHLLSSMTAVVTGDQLLIGIKDTDGRTESFLSLPGSGYLDRELDMDVDGLHPTRVIVGREISEELKIDDAGEIRCLGVFEDLHPNSHLNPALFSIVSTELSPAEITRRAQHAVDAAEFSQLISVPTTDRSLSALIEFDIGELSPGEIAFLPDGEFKRLSHKTVLMLLLLGRHRIGTGWFSDMCDRYDAISFQNTPRSRAPIK